MSNLVKINNQDLQVKEFKGQRVVTFKDIDILHERPEGTAGRNFRENRKYFIKGTDYFQRNSSEAKNEFDVIAPNGLILITESGYLMLVKSLQDNLAWKVQRELVNNYFRNKVTDNSMGALKLMHEQVGAVIYKLDNHDIRIQKIEDNMTIDHAQQEKLNRYGRERVIKVLGGKDAPAYKVLGKKAFPRFWNNYKRVFGVSSYKDTAIKDIDNAYTFIDNWIPDEEFGLAIRGANAQISIVR